MSELLARLLQQHNQPQRTLNNKQQIVIGEVIQYRDLQLIRFNHNQMQALNKQKPFRITGDDFLSSNPIFSYYFYKYFIEALINAYKNAAEQKQKSEIESEMQTLNKQMAEIKANIGPHLVEDKNISQMLEYTELMFAKNDHLYREGQLTKEIAENFLLMNRLYEVVGKFGKLDESQTKRKVYSKKKFIDIMKELKNNPQKELKLPPPQPQIEEQIKKSGFKPLPKPSALISFNKIEMQMEANKALENAVSQLSFDRFKYARQEILKALELIDQIID